MVDTVWLTASLSRMSRNLGKLLRAMEYLAGSAAWLDATAVAALDPGGTSRARMRCSFQSPGEGNRYPQARRRRPIPRRSESAGRVWGL